jgi:hypothetical protein
MTVLKILNVRLLNPRQEEHDGTGFRHILRFGSVLVATGVELVIDGKYGVRVDGEKWMWSGWIEPRDLHYYFLCTWKNSDTICPRQR